MDDREETEAPRLREYLRRPFGLELVWLVLPFAVLGAGFGLLPLRSWDYWWHLSMGRLVDAYHAMPARNLYLYTMPFDAPSYVQAWLSQWGLYRLHEDGGMHVVLLVRNAFAALAYGGIGWWATRRSGSVALGAILALLGGVFGFYCIAARSHLLAWPLFFVVLPLAYAVRRGSVSVWWLALFVPVAILWTNLHGTFLNPFLICLAFFAATIGDRWLRPERFEKRAAWGFALAGLGSLGATFVNPRTYEIYAYFVDLPTNPENLATVSEWFPTTPLYPTGYGALFWVLLAGTLVLMWRARERLDLADLFILLGFSALAIRFSRGLLWVALSWPIVAAPYVRHLGRHFQRDEDVGRIAEIVHVAVASGLVVAVFVLQPWTKWQQDLVVDLQIMEVRVDPPMRGVVLAEVPIEQAMVLEGRSSVRIFHDYRYGGFLVYWLQETEPRQMVFVDNRIELPPPEVWSLYEELGREPSLWRGIFQQYGVTAVIASFANQSELIEWMRGARDWELIMEDDLNALFVYAPPRPAGDALDLEDFQED